MYSECVLKYREMLVTVGLIKLITIICRSAKSSSVEVRRRVVKRRESRGILIADRNKVVTTNIQARPQTI